jgi:hypothetical protein
MYGSDGKCTHVLEKLKGDPGGGRIILKCILGACDEVDWIHEAHEAPVKGFLSYLSD